jgi:DNA repair protein RecN (Recombination protein N)
LGNAVIETLRIEGLALVERVELEFAPGLNVITGETGAGKSVVLGALALLAGARGSVDALREGAREAVVEGVFGTEALVELESELRARGLEADDHSLVVRRTLSDAGRSRAQLAGQLVPVAALAELFAGRIEISSQHESQALLRPESQGRLLDAYGGLLGLREEVAAEFARLRVLDEEMQQLATDAAERQRRHDFLAFQVAEIDEAKLVPGEAAAFSAERARLAHAERLRTEAAAAVACLGGDPTQIEARGAADLLAEAARRIEAAARLDPTLAPLGERLRTLQGEASDAAAELERYAASIDDDEGRLTQIELRLAQLEGLRRKYGASEEAILVFREQAAQELAAVEGEDERGARLAQERARGVAHLAASSARLSEARAHTAERLSGALEAALVELGMPNARIEIALHPAPALPSLPCGVSGAELPEFQFSASKGEAPRSLRRVASGGELSRVFLALKNVLRRASAGMVLVFDEVDAGIGGRAADRMGRVLSELAGEHQVLCITHLPQIAARGSTHLRVTKHARGGRSHVEVERLSAAERVEEIARMAGGEEVSEATRLHARELLSAAEKMGRGRRR